MSAIAGHFVTSGRVAAVITTGLGGSIAALTFILWALMAIVVGAAASWFAGGAGTLTAFLLFVAIVYPATTIRLEQRMRVERKTFPRRNGKGPFNMVGFFSYPPDITDSELRSAAAAFLEATNPKVAVAVGCRFEREAEIFLRLGFGLRRDTPGSTLLVGPPVPEA